MRDRGDQGSLGVVLWIFVAWKIAGVMGNLIVAAVFGLWLIPAGVAAAGLDEPPEVSVDLALLVFEATVTAVGIGLVLRRHRNVRKFWIGLLSIYCAYFLTLIFLDGLTEESGFFLTTGLLWLAYWTWASRARALALSSFWVAPQGPGAAEQ